MKNVVHIDGKGKVQDVQPSEGWIPPGLEDGDAKVALIQALIPLGLAAVHALSGRRDPVGVRA